METNRRDTHRKNKLIRRYISGKYVYMYRGYNLIKDVYKEKKHIKKDHICRRNIYWRENEYRKGI